MSRTGTSGRFCRCLPMLALAVLCMALLGGQVDAHGTLLNPKSRNVLFFESSGSPGAW
jgi:predicted carbohydrate-binding protein with CBM5 and CBM33 domain